MDAIKKIFRTSAVPSQRALVDQLVAKGALYNRRCVAVLKTVDRRWFVVPGVPPSRIYKDAPIGIGAGQTISAPHMHAIALELLQEWLKPGARALDVGSGSGYLTACMALLVRPGGWVLGVEKVPELALRSMESIPAACPELGTDRDCWAIRTGNVLDEELLSGGPFSAIHVGAAADEIHQELVNVLAPGGRMVIPVGPRWGTQMLTAVDKDAAGDVHYRSLMEVGYVPLVRPSEMEDGYHAPTT